VFQSVPRSERNICDCRYETTFRQLMTQDSGEKHMFSKPKLFRFLIPVSAAALAMPIMAPVALAQGSSEKAIEEIITTGTRRDERSASDSSVPIDVISGQELVNSGTTELNELLRNTVPS
jgi:iron complex outermembrane receptor protein